MQYKLVRDQLNTLVKHIEFYKLHNGRYPDSLSQAVQEGDFVFIHDPIQSGMGRSKAEPLNYHKKDDTYYLFSSGYDKVPNTEDDIYPDMNKFDTLKFGLRIEKR